MAINPKRYIDKLVQGLEQHGKYYNVSSKRFYSSNVNRYVTKYTIEDADDKSTRIEVYNKLEILKYLVREWSKVTGEEVPESCLAAIDEKDVKKNGLGVSALNNFKKKRPSFKDGYKK